MQKQYASMPSIGTRVRRGKDWQYGNQDSYGVGTVTGHCDKAGWIFVEWDNGQTFDYRYGNNGLMEAYDLTVCDEPRHIPENQTIATGCLVRRGNVNLISVSGYDWQWGDQDGSEESIGTVYRVEDRGEVYDIKDMTCGWKCNTTSYFQSRLDNNIYSIYVKSKLDYDQPINRFNLTITARNSGDNLQNSTILSIQVTDVDDMDPEFDHNEYYLNITEENSNINNVTTNPPINATDRDKGDDDKNSNGCFTIDNISGKISVTCTLDREVKTDYKLTIKEDPVTSFEILSPYNDTFSSRENGDVIVQNPSKIDRETGNGTIIFKVKALDKQSGNYSITTATVSITLLDINDKAPVFLKQEYGFPLPPEPTEGYEIGQVSATDDDKVNTPNSEIRYRLQHTMSSNFFAIHNKTGKISIQKKPPTSAGVIELVVLAEDLGSPPLQSSAQILLSRTVVKGNAVNFTVPVSVEEAHARKENIQRDIGKLVNLKISVEKIEEVLNHKSSCYLIITAKFQNGSVVSGEDLQNSILQHIGEILALFSEHEPLKLEAPQDTFTPAVIALIVICVLMFLGTIVLIVYIHNTTKRFKRYKRLHKNLTRQNSLYESQELKIEMPDEQTSDYNGSINGSHSLRNSTTGDLKEGVVSAFTNPAFVTDETEIKLTAAEEEAEQSLNDLTSRLEAEENKVMIVDSYNPSESDIELDPINGYENTPAKFAETTPKDSENVPHTFKSADLPEDYPSNDQNEADSENNTNVNMDDDEEPNPDYEVKAVRFSAQVLDTEENKFEPLREKEDKPDLRKDEESGEDLDEEENNEESGDHVNEDLEEDKEDDFGDGIENERTDEEILSPNEVLQDEKSENEEDIPHFSFDTKM
uniref:Protocadherin alpha-11 n=1 Tax=Magallana gigas TaxID=29159 RepID=K1Q8F0_MAGGI